MIVVDTNILAYLLIQGTRTGICRKVLKKDHEWSAPLLWRSELRNVLTTHMRHAGMSFEGAMTRMEEAERLITERNYAIASDVILICTNSNPVSAYDAEYICLATELDTVLVTTDVKLTRTFPDMAVTPENFTSAK